MGMQFRRETIWRGQPADRVLLVTGDINGDGNDEIVVGGRIGAQRLCWYERSASGAWVEHLIDDTYPRLEAGGVLFDVDGNGRLDFIGGGDGGGNQLYWWQSPPDPRQRWTRRLITTMPANTSHDQIVADLDRDGRPELYFWNQGARTLNVAYVPDDPTASPWPEVWAIATDVKEEGFALADVDGDGQVELLAGQSYYKARDGGYERVPFTDGFVSPRLVAGDFSGSGRVEIVLAEGDASYQRPRDASPSEKPYGRLVHLTPPARPGDLWNATVLHDRLEDPHSLIAHDFDGDGRPEVFVGELGDPSGKHRHPPTHRIYDWIKGRPVEHVVDSGIGSHEAKLIRLDGQMGIASKPYRGYASPRGDDAEVDAIHLWMPVRP